MSLASSWGDLVVGIDFHLEMVPTPVPVPTPIPHPHLSLIWDPVGYVVAEVTGMAFAALVGAPPAPRGPVLVGGSMGTVVGDAASMAVKHIIIPPGTAFVVGLPASDAQLFAGSQTVTFRGSSAVRAGEVAFPCSDPLPLPTGAVTPLPRGSGVTFVGGPPGMALGSALPMLGMDPLRTEWASEAERTAVAAIIPEKMQRLRRLASKTVSFFTGHPVNIATGGVSTSAVDLSLPGPIPLTLERDYDTNWFDRSGALGHGWSHTLDSRLWLESGCIALLHDDGREVEFSTRALADGVMREGDTLWHPVERATLRSLGHHRWTLTERSGLTRTYGPVAGEPHDDKRRGCSRILSITDRGGNQVEFRYDDRARLAEVTDSCGRKVAFEHDAGDRLRRVWVPAGDGSGMRQHVEYTYDDRGDLIEVKDAAGSATRFEYDEHLLVRETNRNALSFYFLYDGFGRYARCKRTWGDGGLYDHVIEYDRPGRNTIVTNSLGETTAFACNPLGLVTKITRPHGGEMAYAYDANTRLVAETDELGQVTHHEYDARGNRTQTTAADGAVTQWRFDERDLLVESVDACGGTWAWRYDAMGNVLARTNPLQQTTTFGYEGGKRVEIVDAAGGTTRLSWSGAHALQAVTTPDGSTMRWRHNARGDVIEAVDAADNVQRRRYDVAGRLVSIEEPDGNVLQLAWDPEGNLLRARDRNRDVTMTYWGLGKPASRTVAGTTVEYRYDTEAQLIAVINEAGAEHRYSRDLAGEIEAEVAFDGLTHVCERDAAGRLTKLIRPGAQRFSALEYDAMGRITAVSHSGGGSESYAYDAMGRMLRAENMHAVVEFVRDPLGRVAEETTTSAGKTERVESKYDHAGRRVGFKSSLGAEVSVQRNAMGDVVRVAQHGDAFAAWEATFSRDVFGQEVDRQLSGGARSYWWRDATGRPTQHWVGRPDASARTRKYAWGPGRRLLKLSDEGVGEVDYAYDLRGALAKATHDDGKRIEHRPTDDVGDLFLSLTADDRAYGLAGELVHRTASDGRTTYDYDVDGSLAERADPDGGQWHYHWDDVGMLVQIDRPDGTAVAMEYDALGRRLCKRSDGRSTRWLWDGDRKLHEWQEAAEPPEIRLAVGEAARLAFLEDSRETFGALYGEDGQARWTALLDDDEGHERAHAVMRKRVAAAKAGPVATDIDETVIAWVHDPGSFAPLARVTAAEAHAIVCDHAGTPLVVLDSAAELKAHCVVDANGNATVVGNEQLCPFRFAGQYLDAETGLHENRFRFFDPAVGRYLSRDPIGLAGGLRVYGYVADPTGWVDPLGLASRPVAGGGCGAAGSAGSMGAEGWTAPVAVTACRPVLMGGRTNLGGSELPRARVDAALAYRPGAANPNASMSASPTTTNASASSAVLVTATTASASAT